MDKIPNYSLLLPAVPQRTNDGVIVMKLTNADMIKLRSASYLIKRNEMQIAVSI